MSVFQQIPNLINVTLFIKNSWSLSSWNVFNPKISYYQTYVSVAFWDIKKVFGFQSFPREDVLGLCTDFGGDTFAEMKDCGFIVLL